jgi:hypothetical protein
MGDAKMNWNQIKVNWNQLIDPVIGQWVWFIDNQLELIGAKQDSVSKAQKIVVLLDYCEKRQ